MKKILYLIVAFLLFNCSEKSFTKSSKVKILYVDEIPAIEAFDSDDLKKNTGNIPWNTKVDVIEIINFKESFSIVRFIYQEKEFFAKYSNFSENPPSLFMRVNVDSKLRLREKPTTKSAMIDTLPNGYVTRIESIDPQLYTIENKKGYWFQINYKNKVGWIFSGFAITSTSEIDLNYADNLNFEAEDLESNIQDLKKELEEYKIKNQYTINGYDIIEAVLANPSSSDECRENKKLFISNSSNNFLYKSKEYSAKILKLNHPVKNAIQVEKEYCGCCCPSVGENIIYLGTKAQNLNSFLNNNSMKCSFDYGEQSATYEIMNKFSNENENLKLIRTPDCYEFFYSSFEIESKVTIVPKKYTNEYFVYIKYGDNVELEVFKNEGIPEKFKYLWENSSLNLNSTEK